MADIDYKEFLLDFVSEVLEMTKDKSLYSSSDAYSVGYRSALYTVLHMLEGQAAVWEMQAQDVGLKGFSSDEWRKIGLEYWAGSVDKSS